jgi:hypothetical protein
MRSMTYLRFALIAVASTCTAFAPLRRASMPGLCHKARHTLLLLEAEAT